MSGLSDDPHELFGSWYAKASRHPEIADASAVNLATASKDGMPSNRMVLLKGHDASGFVTYTNLGSRKASELTANPHAALCFCWAPLGRQIRIEGSAKPVGDEEADVYFASRPLASRIGAWASKQSTPLENRSRLMARIARFTSSFALKDPGRPPFWSGFRIVPRRFEFWTEGAYRVHERVVFEKQDKAGWERYLLYP